MLDAILKLYRNTLFRLSLLGAVLFVVSLFISLGYVYYATVSTELQNVEKALRAEVEELSVAHEKNGLGYIQKVIFERSAGFEGRYLLETRRISALSGFLTDQNGKTVAGLIVGRDVEEIMRTADRVRNAIITSSLIALILGLISSVFVSRRFTRRIDGFNRLATDVRAGQLDRRAPRNYSEDELDLLAEHLNAMLDHIDRLMKAMRYAGDSIAHDLRSPLTRLRTRLESTASEIKDEKASDAMWAAADDADQLLKTFDSVLRIARLEAGEQREMLKELDPKLILDDMAELYEPTCEDEGLTFETDIKEGLLILADRGLLSQAISNLVENAIKYTPSGGQLAMVDAIATLHEAEFTLGDGIESDFGPGLSVEIVFPRRRHLRPSVKDSA